MLKTLIYEVLLISFFQYPGVDSYILRYELGNYLALPVTSILCAATYLRFYFALKLFKHSTKWTEIKAEYVCGVHDCSASTGFAFKAFQKENPFQILTLIFISTCACFGMALRIFELSYWETKTSSSSYQNWEYAVNGMWCIFVSLSTVGYGDYHARTIIGRILTICACLIGNYLVSMMMVFMTQKSQLTELQKKSYNILSRLKLRQEITEHYSFLVLAALKMGSYRKKRDEGKYKENEFQIHYCHHKRNVISHIDSIKNKNKVIQTFGAIPLKEKLHNISERIDADVKEIIAELESLKFIKDTLINYSDCQIEMAKSLKKSCYATKLLYNVIKVKPIYDKLNFVKQELKNEFEPELDEEEDLIALRPSDEDEEFEDNIFNYHVDQQGVLEHFKYLHEQNKARKTTVSKFNKNIDIIKRKKVESSNKYKKFQEIIKRKSTYLSRKKSQPIEEI
jgi:hypothetical protein